MGYFFEQSLAAAQNVVVSFFETVFIPRNIAVKEHRDFAVRVAADNRLDLRDVARVHADD